MIAEKHPVVLFSVEQAFIEMGGEAVHDASLACSVDHSPECFVIDETFRGILSFNLNAQNLVFGVEIIIFKSALLHDAAELLVADASVGVHFNMRCAHYWHAHILNTFAMPDTRNAAANCIAMTGWQRLPA